ncbi:MAG: Molybdopterin-binding protein [Betaproteobacteria bacterium]|jgi:molybdopterin-biosynthesis enzyme MoeA-like protein|nr:Molybdopterin-binding protein [Betaproteobacteria bacterium]
MTFGAIIIGDEILSGKRQDKHMAKVIETLGERGLQLAWCHYLADEPELITSTLRRSFASADVVFSFGGIGATPDDHTRQCAAQAAGVELKLHPEAEAEIRARFGAEITPKRLMMGEFPLGSEIIPNPYNRIPGFSMGDHHFVPGFPQMAWPMMGWVLDTRYRALFDPGRIAERSIIVRGAGESQLIDLMNQCLERYPRLKVFSLPRMEPDRHVELGVRGDATQVPDAINVLQQGVSTLGFQWNDSPA